jgi:hypothetical protein
MMAQPRFSPEPSSVELRAEPLETLISRAFALIRQRDILDEQAKQFEGSGSLTVDAEYALDLAVEALIRPLNELCRMIAQRPANTDVELCAKARILRDKVAGNPNDLVEMLAYSTATDLLNRLEPGKGCDLP